MANNFQYQILSNTNKRTVLYLTGELDANGEIANTKIVGSAIPGALAVDANNMVLVSAGGVAKSNYRYTVVRIVHNVNIPNGYLRMSWQGVNTSPTLYNAAGQFDFNVQDNLGVINNTANGPTGNIIFSTVNATANASYSILMELHKDNRDYNAGQINKPNDFNYPGARP